MTGTIPLLMGAFSLLALGVLGGLTRLGVSPIEVPLPAIQSHGALMVSGFLGTLISLERASAKGGKLPLLVPGLKLLGAYLHLSGSNPVAADLLWIAGDLGLIALLIGFWRQDRELHTFVLALGATSLLLGDVRFHPVSAWLGFLVLTIFAERLELSRVRRISTAAQKAFGAAALLILLGVVAGPRWLGLGFAAASLWMLTQDLALRTVRLPGLPRFMALCLITGNLWLLASGLLLGLTGTLTGGPLTDAAVHSALLGFVFSMIFAHAPVILPALTGARLRFHAGFYVHLVLLQLSLLVRIFGDIGGAPPAVSLGATANAIAILLFVVNTLSAAIAAAAQKRASA